MCAASYLQRSGLITVLDTVAPGKSCSYGHAGVAFGHGHIGVTRAATTDRLIAHLVTSQKPCVDPAPYRIDRF